MREDLGDVGGARPGARLVVGIEHLVASLCPRDERRQRAAVSVTAAKSPIRTGIAGSLPGGCAPDSRTVADSKEPEAREQERPSGS